MSLRDERSLEIQDLCVIIQWFGMPCHCRCRHCTLDSGRRSDAAPFDKARSLAERFVRWKAEQGMSDFGVDLTTGYSCGSTQEREAKAFNAKHGKTASWLLTANGMPLRSESDLMEFLAEKKEAGITAVGVTFFGLREHHDTFARRMGDFEQMMLISRAAADIGLQRRETIFLSHERIRDVPALLEVLDVIPGERERCITPWDYRGRGKSLENDRMTASDVLALPEPVKAFMNLGPYASEAEWIERIEAGPQPTKGKRVYLITLWQDNIDRLEALDCGRILQEMRDVDDRFCQAIPSLSTLAQLYGRKTEDKLYARRDLEWKWIDLYLEANPEIETAARFDDLGTTILWR